MNPLYQQLMGGVQMPVSQPQTPVYTNPIQRTNAIMQAMQNPAQFVRNAIPDLPNEIANDPRQILQWLQKTRGITDAQIQQAAGMIPRF